MNNLNKMLKSYFFYVLCALGTSLTIKASIGISSYNAMNLSIAKAFDIKVGTITTVLNILFLVGYMILSNFKHKKKYIIQALSVFMFGFFINFFVYNLLSNLNITNYLLNVLVFTMGTVIGGLSVGVIISYNVITFPLESFCIAISEKTNFSFLQLRYSVDVFSVTVSIIVSYLYNLPYYIREGTIISLFILSAAMNFGKNIHTRYLNSKRAS